MTTATDFQNYYLSLTFLLHGHFWLNQNGTIGRLTPAMAVFVQRAHLEQLHRGKGNKAKRRMGIDPEKNTGAPWVKMTWK